MNKIKTFVALAFAAVSLLAGADSPPMRLDVIGQPEGARVFVDGQLSGTLGSSPCTVVPLSPGRHLLHVEAKNFIPLDTYVELTESANFVKQAVDLKPEHGLVLLKSNPSGATVSYNGRDVGKTPLLMTSLACGRKHTLELAVNGYQRKRIDVEVDSRRPIVRTEDLVLDSGIITCHTEPSGATVLVNGIKRGVTPVDVMIPRGGAELTVRLEGYQDVTQSIGMSAGERRTISLKLEGLPVRLSVVSEPEQAKVYLDGNYQGKSPATIESVRPGAHELRVELSGYATETRTLLLEGGGDATETFTLKNVRGRLEIVTSPPGAKITLDGRTVGTTKAQGEAYRSMILKVEDVAAGEHAIGVSLDGHLDVSRKITIDATETKQVYIPLKRNFIVDTEVETINGAPVRGAVDQSQTNPQQIVIETRPGVFRYIPRETIRKITPIMK